MQNIQTELDEHNIGTDNMQTELDQCITDICDAQTKLWAIWTTYKINSAKIFPTTKVIWSESPTK